MSSITNDTYHFLSGGGKMGEMIRSYNWSETSLGPIESWPQSLRTSLSLILTSYYPLFFWWGEDYIQFYNDAYTPILGSKHPKSLGQQGKECWPEAWHLVEPMIHLVKQGESTFNKNTLLPLQRNGYIEECYFDFAYSPIRDEAGAVAGIFAAVSETTDQVINERRLGVLTELGLNMLEAKSVSEACQLSLQVLSNSPIDIPYALIYLKDNDGFKLVNSYGLDDHAGARPAFIKQKDTSGWNIWEVLSTKQPYLEKDTIAKFGNLPGASWPVPSHEALILPLNLPAQTEPIGILIAGISPGKAFNDAYSKFLRLASGHIETAISNGKTYEEERQRMEKLLELDRAKTNFFNNVSHEFRTPLTLMLGPLEDTLSPSNKALSEKDREQLTTVHQNSLRLLKLVNTLLDFSRITAQSTQVAYQPTKLCSLTSDLASAFESVAQKAGLAYKVVCEPFSVPVYVDPEMWEKIVLNLLSNAFKFTFEGEIQVRLQETSTHAVLTVQDTGVGIPPHELPNLFKRFHRIQNSRSRSHEGTGIGLALVKELVELHQGNIEVNSIPDKGTTFTIRIPKRAAQQEQENLSVEQGAASTAVRTEAYVNEVALWNPTEEAPLPLSNKFPSDEAATAHSSGTTILLVDDNADMLKYLKRIISAYWQVTTARDGVEALAAIRQKTPDLILSDIMMPRMDGFELLSAIRQDRSISHLPVILLSARAGEEATVEGLEKGANDYLVKPFSAPELIARIKTQLELKFTQQDNAQLRKIEEELKQYKIISDYAFDAFILMREDGTFAYLNDLALKRWGYSREEALSLRVPDVDPIYQEEKFNEVFALAQKEAIPTFETIHKRKDGTTYPVEVSMGGITLNGKPHMFAVARDITERKQAEEALRQSEAHFSSIFNQTFVGIAETDLEGRFIMVNDRYCQIVGRSKKELSQLRMQDITHPEDLISNLGLFKRAVNESIPFEIEKRYVRPDGSEVWVNNNVSLIKDLSGKPQYVVAVSQDITDHKLAQMALQESEERFRNMADAAPVIIWMGNTKGENIYLNPAWSKLTGKKAEEHAAYNWQEAIHAEDLAGTWEIYNNALQQAKPFSLEFRVRRYDGEYRQLYCQGSPRLGTNGEFLGFVGVCEDVTERKLAAEALAQSEEHFRTFANNIQNLAWMANPDGWTYWYNQRWYDYTGTTFTEMQAYGWQKIIHPDHTERVVQHVREAGARNEPWELSIPLRGADGQYRWFLTRAYAVTDTQGKLIRWIGTNTDIEEQKRAEDELKTKNEELQKTNNDLDNFIYTASHDLKAPITNIEGLMSMLVRHLPPDSLKIPVIDKVISMTKASVNRFKNTINELTEVAKLQRTTEEDIHQVELYEIFEEIRLDLASAIQEAGASIEVDFSTYPSFQFSKKNLRSVIYNLVSNAVKYRSPERPPIVRVTAKAENGFCVLQVEDNGLGMDLSKENKVFSMFKRLHDHVEGTGLGLYIVKKIMDNSGGKVEVESEVGKGSIFRVYFKCTKDASHPEQLLV